MGILNQYLEIKNRIKFNDAIMDGIARAISNGVEQHVSQQLLLNNNSYRAVHSSFESNNVIETDIHEEEITAQPNTEPLALTEPNTNKKKSFKELKASVQVFSNGEHKGVYDLKLDNVSAEPNNEQYLRVRECITKILLHYLEVEKENSLREKLFIDNNDEKFTAVLYLTLYFLIRSSIMKMKTQDEYIEDTLLALDNAVVELPQIGQWIVDAGRKYSAQSEILNNPESDKIIEFLYENSSFKEAPDKNIYIALINFRNEVISYVITTLKTELSDLYKEVFEKNLAEKKRIEREQEKERELQIQEEINRKFEEEKRLLEEQRKREKKEQEEKQKERIFNRNAGIATIILVLLVIICSFTIE